MEQIVEKLDQTSFNHWVAQYDDELTYKEVVAEAEAHDLSAEEAILFANLFPGGEGL